MRYTFTYCLLFMLAFLSAPAFAQEQITVQGKVVDSLDGLGIPGVSVFIKGTTQGTQTDLDGNYSIAAPSNATLTFSFISYGRQEIPVNNRTTINVTLSTSSEQLDQVVVVGYGTQRRSQVVGSISSVSGGELAKQPVLTAAQALQGKASGVQITSSGEPGTQSQVRVRGVSSVSGDANPIYVVDGVITGDITNISTSDIQSIEVLKDASSQAIYGSRAGNGVILVTTKAGRAGDMRIGLNAYTGFRTPTSKVKMADARTYAAYSNEALERNNNAPLFDLNNLPNNTDWFDAITHNGLVQNYEFNLSGGTEKTTYYFSAGYMKDEGIVKGEDFERGIVRINNEYRIIEGLKLGHNLNLSYTHKNDKPNVFASAYRMAPTAAVRNPDGSYGYLQQLSVGNPVATLDYTNSAPNQLRLQGNVFGEVNPIEGLTLRSSFNFDRYDNNNRVYVPVYSVFSGQQNTISRLSVNNSRGFYYIWNNQATYDRTFNDLHEVSGTVGYSAERDRRTNMDGSVQEVPAERNLWYLDRGNESTLTINNSGSVLTRASVFGRLTYTFDRKYNISGTLRRDGSSNFPVGQKWGTFYSLGGSWVISEEGFMQDQTIFDMLRVRLGYGKVGNDNVSGLAILNGVATTGNYSFGGDSFDISRGITFNQIKDADATWEPTEGIDGGLEFGTLNGRLTGEIAYYNKQTNAYINVTYPSTLGDADNTVFSRAATVRNKGWEFALNWRDAPTDAFNYFAGFNITFNRNNVENVAGNLQLKSGSLNNGEIVTYTVEGQPIGSFWLYDAVGIFQNQEQIDTTPHVTGTRPGDLIFADTNGDGIIDEKDRIFAGSYQPKTYFGFNAGFNYKQFDFSVDTYGNIGNKVYNGKKAVRLGNDNIEMERAENRWSPSNTNGTQPAASNSIPKPSTYYMESGDFFRINNVTLGYTFNSERFAALGKSSLRVYATMQNPVIWKSYSGYTPELPGSAIASGIELDIYPVFSTYMFGINYSF
jgi:TonB-linked SusC/RagA family outer membrane protein